MKNLFHARLKEPITWHIHLALPKKKFLPEKCLILNSIIKKKSSNKKIFHIHLKKPILYPKKKFLCLQEKITNFPLKEKISYYYKKKQFFKQKNVSFQMFCVFNTTVLFFVQTKLNKVM